MKTDDYISSAPVTKIIRASPRRIKLAYKNGVRYDEHKTDSLITDTPRRTFPLHITETLQIMDVRFTES
jgi:hypothetical protein